MAKKRKRGGSFGFVPGGGRNGAVGGVEDPAARPPAAGESPGDILIDPRPEVDGGMQEEAGAGSNWAGENELGVSYLARKDLREQKLDPKQRLMLLDVYQRSGMTYADFGDLVGISKHTLYSWHRRFKELGPEGLLDQPRRSPAEGKLSELTKRVILMLKQAPRSMAASASATCSCVDRGWGRGRRRWPGSCARRDIWQSRRRRGRTIRRYSGSSAHGPTSSGRRICSPS